MEQITLVDVQRLRKGLSVECKATISFANMKTRNRTSVLRALKEGCIRGGWGSVVRRVAQVLFDQAGVFYISASRTRGGGAELYWAGLEPAGWRKQLNRLIEAENTARTIEGLLEHKCKVFERDNYCRFRCVTPHDLLVDYLKAYTSTMEYKATVGPYIDMVRNGATTTVGVR